MSKYGSIKTQTIDGMVFDSRKEATRYGELKLMERAGLIKDLQTQVKFELIPKQGGGVGFSFRIMFCYYVFIKAEKGAFCGLERNQNRVYNYRYELQKARRKVWSLS